jgi:broad specificity phosphatase PhoE
MSGNTLLLLRHGCVGWKWEGRYIGSTDLALSEEGAAQLRAVAARLREWAPVARCYCSPLLRARQTAAALSPALAAPPEILEDIREVDFGRWEGRNFLEISAGDHGLVTQWAELTPGFAFPEGEALAAFAARVERFCDRVLALKGTTLVVTHGGVVRAMLCHLLGLDAKNALAFAIAPGTLCVVKVSGGMGVLTELAAPRP